MYVLIPFLAGLLFGPHAVVIGRRIIRLNPLFGGSAFRTDGLCVRARAVWS